jgi:GTP diphosphokinase / guanosine-3',5'-bis(diphosphate) 3'-diphosphatase
MIRQFELVDLIKSYDPNVDEEAIDRAYVFAMKAHGQQRRESGDPYFLHPLEVAGILTDYKLDSATIVTALLHDTIEDTIATQEEIDKIFGKEVGRLVDGVTKLTRIEMQSDQANQAENFRKLLLAMSDDIRVLLVKLADRLHNMRTLHHVKKNEKRRRIAIETMDIFAPLAERIGMQEMKNELEDLAFMETNPEARASVMARLEFLRIEDGDLVARIKQELTKTLSNGGLSVEVMGREKLPYSIWNKMQHKDIAFEQLSDIVGFRVLVDSVDECYKALGILHRKYRVVPGRFKDFISTAKPNGYRSLHTGVLVPEQHRVEIQIRTNDMHNIAENGVAAHWTYKQNAGKTEGRQYRWIKELLDILEHAASPSEFLEHTKLEMYQDQVFCFTPLGDLINMPNGATAVDFAYAVHSEVGDRCVGAKVNSRIIPLNKELRNGDQVEILTSKVQTPSPTWERFVVTGKARARIRRFVHLQERQQYLQLGRAILQRAFREEGYEFADKALKAVLKKFDQDTTDDLTSKVGAGNINARDVVEAVFPRARKHRNKNVVPLKKIASENFVKGTSNENSKNTIPIKGLIPGMAMHYADCCHPLPGDRIVGILTTGKGVTIHTIDCDTLEEYSNTPENWLDVSWQQQTEVPDIHVGRVHLTVVNEPGVLGTLSMVIGKNGGNISNLKITNRTLEFYDLLIDIEVQDLRHLMEIIAALRATPAINMVERAHG